MLREQQQGDEPEETEVQKLAEQIQWESVDLPSIETIVKAFENGLQVCFLFITRIVHVCAIG